MKALVRSLEGRLHYGWIVLAVTFVALLAAGGIRSTPSVLIVPLEESFGWSRATITFAIAINILLYGLVGPFAAALMQRIGIRRTLMAALAVISASVAASTLIAEPWQLVLTWGLMVGLGTGVVALALGAAVVNLWFVERRGLAMGVLAASTATGQLVFLPLLAAVSASAGWRPVALIMAGAAALVIPLIAFLMPERPRDVGLSRYGAATADEISAAATANPVAVAFRTLGRAARSRHFWLLFASFFVCGLSTNGLVGTHLIAACLDQGIPEVRAAGLLAMMGIFDLIGTTLSGWLSDRYDSRWLLFWYYALRGLSLIFLPYSDFTLVTLSVFAVFYGLNWIATVPPTVRLTTDIFGRQDAPIIFGWILTGHQLGGATAAFGAGLMRTNLDGYLEAFLAAGLICVATAFLVLEIGRDRPARPPVPEAA